MWAHYARVLVWEARRRALGFRRALHGSAAVLSAAPHDLGLYERMMREGLETRGVRFLLTGQFRDRRADPRCVNLVLRHDIDADPERLFAMADIEARYGIRSTIYVRADEREYRLRDYGDRLRGLYSSGFEIGLHSVAYVASRPDGALSLERGVFAASLGFQPTLLTTHGVYPGSLRLAARRQFFIRETVATTWPTVFSDEFGDQRFDVYLGDANFDAKRTMTYITPDFVQFAGLAPGTTVQLLTHPQYWA
jgi:hypothetical protein